MKWYYDYSYIIFLINYLSKLYILIISTNMINKGAESLPGKDAQAYKQLAVKLYLMLEIT